MSESKHTTWGKLTLCKEMSGVAQIDNKTIFIALPGIIETEEDLALRRKRAKELLRRWNNHDALLKALKAIAQMEKDHKQRGIGHDSVIDATATTAIANAEKED